MMVKMMAARLGKMDTSHKEMVDESKPKSEEEMMACRETTEARLEEEKPTSSFCL
jgi:hypothetical protein